MTSTERSPSTVTVSGWNRRGVVGTEFVGDDTTPGAVAMFELHAGLLVALYPRTELAKDANVTPALCRVALSASGTPSPAALAQAESAGATLTDKPHDRPWGIYSGYFRAPDRHLWEIIWNPQLQVVVAALSRNVRGTTTTGCWCVADFPPTEKYGGPRAPNERALVHGDFDAPAGRSEARGQGRWIRS